MTTTHEQLQAWRVAARFAYGADTSISISSDPHTAYIAGYLRRCQETSTKDIERLEAIRNLENNPYERI